MHKNMNIPLVVSSFILPSLFVDLYDIVTCGQNSRGVRNGGLRELRMMLN